MTAEQKKYLETIFPTFMSYLPGGISYNLNQPVEVNVERWLEQLDIVVEWITAYNLTVGGNVVVNEPATVDPVFYSYSTNVRKARNKWKRQCQLHDIDCSDELWRRLDGREHNPWAAEWDNFQACIAAKFK